MFNHVIETVCMSVKQSFIISLTGIKNLNSFKFLTVGVDLGSVPS